MLLTLIFLLITTAMSVVMLFVLTSLIGSKAAGVREWMQANGFAVAGVLLIAVRGHVPDIVSIEFANGLLLVTFGLVYIGFRRHLGQSVSTLPLVVGGMLALGGMAFFDYVVDSAGLRTFSASAYHAVVCFAIVATIPRTDDPHLRFPFVFTRLAALALGATHAFRGTFYAVSSVEPSIPVDIATWNLIFLACGTLALPALVLGVVMMANAQARREAAYAASHDLPTGAWSRDALSGFAEHEHARAERMGVALSLLVFEVDQLRRINDTHGQATGERVLREIVTSTQDIIRNVDVCARLDGERFGVLLPDASRQTAMEVAARLHTALDGALQPAPSTLPLAYTVSIGVATLALGEPLAGLMGRAEAALKTAKAEGRNRVVGAPLPPRVERVVSPG